MERENVMTLQLLLCGCGIFVVGLAIGSNMGVMLMCLLQSSED